MFSDDSQMTLIMRHLKEFAAVSVTNLSRRKASEFHYQICFSTLNQMRIFPCPSQLHPSSPSPLFDPPQPPNHYSPLQTEHRSRFATPPLLISAPGLRVSKSGTSDILATYSCVSLQLPVTSIHPLTFEYCTR